MGVTVVLLLAAVVETAGCLCCMNGPTFCGTVLLDTVFFALWKFYAVLRQFEVWVNKRRVSGWSCISSYLFPTWFVVSVP